MNNLILRTSKFSHWAVRAYTLIRGKQNLIYFQKRTETSVRDVNLQTVTCGLVGTYSWNGYCRTRKGTDQRQKL
jgi:hypothetical protein